jgi:SagB-type dehydrogenase family enzyme
MAPFNPFTPSRPQIGLEIALPAPALAGSMSVEQALHERRSQRSFQEIPLTLAELSQLLWAAQGVTDPRGLRTTASAGGLYPLELLVAAGNVSGLDPGVYHYQPHGHSLTLVVAGDLRAALSAAAVGQDSVAQAPAVLALAGVYERTSVRYRERGRQYVHMEVGIASQNVHLQAVALGLGTVFIGAFDDAEVQSLLGLAADERPLCLMPVGRPTD